MESAFLRDLCFFCRVSDPADVLSLAGACRVVAGGCNTAGASHSPAQGPLVALLPGARSSLQVPDKPRGHEKPMVEALLASHRHCSARQGAAVLLRAACASSQPGSHAARRTVHHAPVGLAPLTYCLLGAAGAPALCAAAAGRGGARAQALHRAGALAGLCLRALAGHAELAAQLRAPRAALAGAAAALLDALLLLTGALACMCRRVGSTYGLMGLMGLLVHKRVPRAAHRRGRLRQLL